MPRYGRLLTDAQWETIQPLLPQRRSRPKGGRPPPHEFPHPATCWRRLRDWAEQGIWRNIWPRVPAV